MPQVWSAGRGLVLSGGQLSTEDLALIRDFLKRSESLETGARERLAQKLAARVCANLGQALPLEPELFLLEFLHHQATQEPAQPGAIGDSDTSRSILAVRDSFHRLRGKKDTRADTVFTKPLSGGQAFLVGCLLLILLPLGVCGVCALHLTSGGADNAVSPARAGGLTSPEGMVLNELKGGPICKTREAYEQLVANAIGHNKEATFGLMRSGECSMPPVHTRVSIADTAIVSGLVKVRPYEDSMPWEGWTADENVCMGRPCD